MDISLGGFLLFIAMLYIITAALWGVYAGKQQMKNYANETTFLRYILVLIVNMIFMPICIMAAIIKE